MNRHKPAAAAGTHAPDTGTGRWRLRLLAVIALAALLLTPAAAQLRSNHDDGDTFSPDELGEPPPDNRGSGDRDSRSYQDDRSYRDDRAYQEERDYRDERNFRDEPPRGSEVAPAPAASARPQETPAYSTDEPQGSYSTQSPVCRQLESQLASDYWRGQDGASSIPDLNQRIDKQDALFNKLQNDADQMDCYENMFIFGRSLKRTKKCLDIDAKIRDAKRDLMNLRDERAAIRDSRTDGNNRNRLIEELAHNNCGDQYRYEAQRNSSGNWFGGGGIGDFLGVPSRPKPRPADAQSDQIQPYTTYRTMCVRLCDGFYYPVSFSTLPSNFPQDANACRTGCAAPAELYVYRNPGGEVEQMISPDGKPYDGLTNAWRFRKEFIKGCSCKPAEYSEADIAAFESKSVAAPAPAAATGNGSGNATTATPPAPGAAPASAETGKSSALPADKAATPGANDATAAHVTPDKARSIDDLIR